MNIREKVMERSGGHCEAMLKVRDIWTRCGRSPVEDHHLLTRARGGGLLDDQGEIGHHLCCCRTHHQMAHGPDARDRGLLIDGYAYRDGAYLLYSGPDPYLSATYSRSMEVPILPEALPGADHDQGTREEL